jgi:tetratricopeptide (TPR) repeat protein
MLVAQACSAEVGSCSERVPWARLLAVALAALVILPSCGANGTRRANRSPGLVVSARSGAEVALPRTVVTAEDTATIPELFARAAKLRDEGKLPEAARAFDRVFTLDPEGPQAGEALLQGGDAYDRSTDLETALSRYEQLARRYPNDPIGHEGLVRSLRVLSHLERWERAGTTAELLLARPDQLKPEESTLALGAKALAQLQRGDVARAEYSIEKGRDVIDEHRLDAAGRISTDLVLVYYALGEVRRLKAGRIGFEPVPANFAAVLEERCQLILSAQSAYSDAMRAYDSHWSAMAGFRVGELYQALHQDLMHIPPPANARTERQRQLFEGAMRLRYAVLLRKARAMMEHTLSMAKRTGEQSAWVSRAEEALQNIGQAETTEEQALDRLPYSRAEFEAAFERMAKGGAI